MRVVTDELDRMARIVDELLLLAKAEQPDFLRLGTVEVSDLTTELLVKARALGDRTWKLDACADGRCLRGRAPADPGDAEPGAQRGRLHRARRRDRHRERVDGGGHPVVGPGRRARRRPRPTAAGSSNGLPAARSALPVGGCRARACDRASDRGGARWAHHPCGAAPRREPSSPSSGPAPPAEPPTCPRTRRSTVTRILIAEDEPRHRDVPREGPEGQRVHAPSRWTTGRTVIDLARESEGFDLLVLDLGLPLVDGIEALRRDPQSAGERLPVVILSARDQRGRHRRWLRQRRRRLRHQALPFRRAPGARARPGCAAIQRHEPTVLRAGGIALDLRTRRVVDRRRRPSSSPLVSSRCSSCSCGTPTRCCRREQLLANVWGYDFDPGSNVVEVYVRYLRKKLGDAAIQTVRGMGYRLVA